MHRSSLLLLLSVVGCSSSDSSSSLVGTIDVSMTGEDAPIRLGTASAKFRAQIDDDGATCKLEATINSYADGDAKIELDIQPTAAESAGLVVGQPATVTAHENGVIANNATVYLVRGASSFQSKTGSVAIDPLPAPKGKLRIRFQDVGLMKLPDATEHTLTGEATVTYIGVVATSKTGARACPGLPPMPPGLVL